MSNRIALHEPKMNSEDEFFVLDALRSHWVSTAGPYVNQFEQEFAAYTGMKHAISVCNGTAGLALAVDCVARMRNVGKSYCVLVPTLSFAATWNAVIQAGGIPIPIDTAPSSVNMDLNQIKIALTNNFVKQSSGWHHKTLGIPLLAVLPAHILGWACPSDEVKEFLDDAAIPMIEDAAEALGSRYLNGKHVGHHGLASVFSFNGNKILTTGGGGMLVTNDDVLAKRAKHLATTAKTDSLRFVHDEPGYNFRMVNMLAALGCSQLRRLDSNLALKAKIASDYHNATSAMTAVTLYTQKNCNGNNWINTVTFSTEARRESCLADLNEHGIEARPLWTPLHLLPYYPKQSVLQDKFPNAEKCWKTMLSLPSSPQLTAVEFKKTIDIVAKH